MTVTLFFTFNVIFLPSLGRREILKVSARLHLFVQKYSNIVKNYYILKRGCFILIHIKMEFI